MYIFEYTPNIYAHVHVCMHSHSKELLTLAHARRVIVLSLFCPVTENFVPRKFWS